MIPVGYLGELRANLGWKVKPYKVDCPSSSLPDGECPDIFTMEVGEEKGELMAFRVTFLATETNKDAVLVDFASSVVNGGRGSDPGRCLSNLADADREAFLSSVCSEVADCNVRVVASRELPGTEHNDKWVVDVDDGNTGITGLICNFNTGEVYGIYPGAIVDITAEEVQP